VGNLKKNEKKSTREIILDTIKKSPQSRIDLLATAADVSPVTVRHHLNSLLADGLIEAESVRRKVGRPYYVYSLSDKGQELFPQKYYSLTNRLLDELKNQFPPEALATVFAGVVENIVENHVGQFEELPFEERLDYLIMLLKAEGFLARWEKTEDGYQIIEYSCPYISVGQKHSEVCSLDKELMLTVLGTEVEQHSCMIDGADCCHFTVKIETIETVDHPNGNN
jgi:DeoR family suf operon transcriptional repressor